MLHEHASKKLNEFEWFLFFIFFICVSWLQRKKILANVCITVSWYLCQAPFSHSAVGAGPSQPLRVGLRSFPLGLISLLHISVLYRHVPSRRFCLTCISTVRNHTHPAWPSTSLSAGSTGRLQQERVTCYPPIYLQLDLFSHSEGGKRLHSRCQQECSGSCSLWDTQSAAASYRYCGVAQPGLLPQPQRDAGCCDPKRQQVLQLAAFCPGERGESLAFIKHPM